MSKSDNKTECVFILEIHIKTKSYSTSPKTLQLPKSITEAAEKSGCQQLNQQRKTALNLQRHTQEKLKQYTC
jgi:hypothetical protein